MFVLSNWSEQLNNMYNLLTRRNQKTVFKLSFKKPSYFTKYYISNKTVDFFILTNEKVKGLDNQKYVNF